MSTDSLDMIGKCMLNRKVQWSAAVVVLSQYGVTVRREPCGLSFWQSGKHRHFVW